MIFISIPREEKKLAKMIGQQKLFQWENYVEDKKHDLNKMNEKIFALIKVIEEDKFQGRKRDYFKKIKLKYLIENDPDVAFLRNKLDDRENYNNGLNKEKPYYKNKLAFRLREDVVNLIKIRNQKAQEYGFSNYPELLFHSEELDEKKVKEKINNYLHSRIDKANKLIKKYNLNWNEWFDILRSIGELKYYNEPYHYINCLFHKLGLDSLKENIRFEIQEQPISGMAFPISIPDDVRILLKPTTSVMNCRTLFHECGHVINYVSNKKKGIFTLYTTFFDEFTAILFEMELWKDPDKAEDLFIKYQNIFSIPAKRKERWALDTFRYIDPVYVHNYALGEIYAQKVINKLEKEFGDDLEKWGETIQNIFLKEGMRKSFEEKIEKYI